MLNVDFHLHLFSLVNSMDRDPQSWGIESIYYKNTDFPIFYNYDLIEKGRSKNLIAGELEHCLAINEMLKDTNNLSSLENLKNEEDFCFIIKLSPIY